MPYFLLDNEPDLHNLSRLLPCRVNFLLCAIHHPMIALTTMKSLFLLLLLFVTQIACQDVSGTSASFSPRSVSSEDTITYDVSQTITLVNEGPAEPEKHNLWVALISDQLPYQQVVARDIEPSNHTIVTDEFGNQYAEFDFKSLEPGATARVNINYVIAVNELTYDQADCVGDVPDMFTQPELHIESRNPQIVALAEELTNPEQTLCQQARSFYDYIGSNLVYSYNGQDWGAQAALGKMGADCTEYSSLLIALSRAAGIPARYVEGLLYLGENSAIDARQEHAWVELYFPGTGWVPVDPTLGRSSLTREQHFARYSPNHIIITNGRNPSTLRGASYWSHLYWPGDSTVIRVEDAVWTINPRTAAQAQ
jgi:transglutaminase-like putative cysteine protease